MTPELFPLRIPRRHNIASPHRDEPLQRRCQGGGRRAGCESDSLIALLFLFFRSVSLVRFSHQGTFRPPPPFPPRPSPSSISCVCPHITSTVTVAEQKQRRQDGMYMGVGGGGLEGVARLSHKAHGAAGQQRAPGLITPLLGGSAWSCLNRPWPAGD